MKAVFLDRDNTLIENDGDLGRPEEVRLRPGAAAALRALHEQGYRLVVVTNQGGVARGAYSESDVDAVHQRIAELIDDEAGVKGVIDRFYYCPYHPEGTVQEYRREHPWRKPQPGMLIQAARDLSLNLRDCWMIGDQARDIQAGFAAGCRTVLVRHDETPTGDEPEAAREVRPTYLVHDIRQAAEVIVRAEVQAGGLRIPAFESHHSEISRPQGRASPGPSDGPERPRLGGPKPDLHTPHRDSNDVDVLRRAVHDLAEEIRTERLRRAEFTVLRMAAGLCQLAVILLALLALLQAGRFEAFIGWMTGALLLQLIAITLLLFDARS